ncbi:PREDICTED: C2 and GRAM domain-containing protein At1g03370-like isoform X2 [Ipomoea nil]|uniref:C2 and GRAM domain-containing protein At1g03370-like isoform X2 n=1 Tax=Ipomoea nil TaxID=35883 RepID=UPI0009014B25|nr:PREDICTED: C2 and GRAM domain-containing protein At1g03370-like isoform X2 [Ipomoea nil]
MNFKLLVRVIEARNIPGNDPNGLSDPYVKLQLGRQKFRTKVVKKCLNPSWCEEFAFRIDEFKEELGITVLREDKYFNDDFVGQVKFNISKVFETEGKSLGTAWYTLQPKHKKTKNRDCGQILLTICFPRNNLLGDTQAGGDLAPLTKKNTDAGSESIPRNLSFNFPSPGRLEETSSFKDEKSNPQTLVGRLYQIFNKNGDGVPVSSSVKVPDIPDISESVGSLDNGDTQEERLSSVSFEEMMKSMETREQESELPSNLPGVVVDQIFATAPRELNSLLFSPDSNFLKSLMNMQGSTELNVGPWKFENGSENLKRVVCSIKAPSKLVKALKATEEQTYMKADGKTYAISCTVSTPDAPYGSTFRTEVLYCITSGPELPSGEESSRLVVSWRMNFLQSTMMKSLIENGARQGSYVLLHILLATPSTIQGLEFAGLDLPDSIGELIVCGVLVLQGKRVLDLVSRFMQARVQRAKGGDHGVKALGDGWLLTVALIEGSDLVSVDSGGFSNPYVVFTCNGRTRASSIKFRSSSPKWNEIFEFDAMEEPPSLLNVEVFYFDGPSHEAASIGHAEINFIKTKLSDLSDIWITLQGKLALACQSKLHLRIFLNNTKGSNVAKDYLSKMEKEIGKKIKLRSPQTNSAFQKLFHLPPEEFLINDFSCQLKRKMPLQGRLFLSVRIMGFNADLFGHRTNFFFLWEDIEDIQVIPKTLASIGSPIVIVTLKSDKGFDAKHSAKTHDEEGRLKFHFQSFVSFNVAIRMIMALWKARALSPEQKARIVEEESKAKSLQIPDEDSIDKTLVVDEETLVKNLQSEEIDLTTGDDDPNMSIAYSSVLSVPTDFFMELFSGSELDRRVMERAGCLNYSCSLWESEKPEVYQRQLYYKFEKCISRYRAEVTSTQQKSRLLDKYGWLIEEVMTLHGVPFGDYFDLNVRYQVEDVPSRATGCNVQVQLGVQWSKYCKHQKRITKNITSNLQERLLVMFSALEKEYLSEQQLDRASFQQGS